MPTGPRRALIIALCGGALACSSSSSTSPNIAAGTGGSAVIPIAGSSVPRAGTGAAGSGIPGTAGTGSTALPPPSGGAGSPAVGGAGAPAPAGTGAAGIAAQAGSSGRQSAGAGGVSGAAGGGGGAGGSSSGGTTMWTGTLGALGPAQPVMGAFAITNGPETIIYTSSAPLTCAQMSMMGVKWLSMLPAKSQVVEIVVPGTASAKSYNVGMFAGEVNYAEGSKSSSTETRGSSGTIVFTKASKGGVHEGMVMATFPMGSVMGTFHAEWCPGGTEY